MNAWHWQHQTVTTDANGEVPGVSPYNPQWGTILQFGGWAHPGSDSDEPVVPDSSKQLLPLAATYPSFNNNGDFIQAGLRFIATPGSSVRVHSWALTTQ